MQEDVKQIIQKVKRELPKGVRYKHIVEASGKKVTLDQVKKVFTLTSASEQAITDTIKYARVATLNAKKKIGKLKQLAKS
jgi:hypothetical protein